MFQSLYNSLSGLFSFSRSLDTVSNNVANMNTPGFRGSDSLFSNLSDGHGTRIVGEALRTGHGDLRQTGSSTDVAIDGNGYFVLRDGTGALHYTRAGQFGFDDRGILVDQVSGFDVMAIDTGGNLGQLSMEDLRTLPAEPTTRVTISGNLSPSSTGTTISSIAVYDANGNPHTIKASFAAPANVIGGGRSYAVTLTDESGAAIGSDNLVFTTAGTLTTGSGTLTAMLDVAGVKQEIIFSFGTAGTYSGTTSLSGLADNLSATVVDGRAVLGISTLSFDEKGVLEVAYSQTEKKQGQQLALATFRSESALQLREGRLLSNVDAQRSELGRAGSTQFGRIAGGSLEMSNIDLTQEFADMLIIQRGYQASSRVMNISNEMVEQLYNSTRGG